MSFLTPNKIEWAKCPHCEFTLNTWEGVSLDALGNRYFVASLCPNKKCKKKIGIKVRIEFKVEAIDLSDE